MAINISVQYNGGLLPDIILLSRGYYHRGTRLNIPCRGFVCTAFETVYYHYPIMFDDVLYYIVSVLFLLFVWCPCVAINKCTI